MLVIPIGVILLLLLMLFWMMLLLMMLLLMMLLMLSTSWWRRCRPGSRRWSQCWPEQISCTRTRPLDNQRRSGTGNKSS